jgi:signal transduction histidine kinase
VDAVSVYAELEPHEVSVFVKDRGMGFDMDAIADDRQGIRGSIVGRVERHGGTVRLTSAKGAGTEVELRMKR